MSAFSWTDSLAAVDLGSNSFHMVVAREAHGQARVVDRIAASPRVQLVGYHVHLGSQLADPAPYLAALDVVERFVDRKDTDIVVTTGGTGVTPDDVTVEAVEPLLAKELPGVGELFRRRSYEEIGTMVVATRATAGVAGGTYLFALPGSTGACMDAWDDILIYQLDIRHKPCNFVELIPRLQEHLAAE